MRRSASLAPKPVGARRAADRLMGPAVLAIALSTSGCTGVGDYISDTFSPYANPNRPLGDSETLHRVNGQQLDAAPLLPEPGNVWPGPVKLQPSLQDVMQQGGAPGEAPGAGGLPPPNVPASPPRQPLPPGVAPETNFPPLPRANVPPSLPPAPGAGPLSRVPQLPSGTNLSTQPITIDNGNGTSTVIKPDGTIETVPNKP